MRELGHDPFAAERFDNAHTIRQLIDDFESLQGTAISIPGRLVSFRLMGKAAFAHISDGEAKIQVYVRKDDVGDHLWEVFQLVDVGDHIGVSGDLFLTKTGEKTLHVRSFQVLSKCFQNLPIGKEKDGQTWYGLSDIDLRYRHRHLDLICNPDARRLLINRCRLVSAVRRFLDKKDFLEVETPMLQLEAGGASARPFLTIYNKYKLNVKLRISLELYLKRLICGDLPRVYEIGRVFRNEGVDNSHNPEFTLLEFYQAYANLEDVMGLVEEMFRDVTENVFGTSVITAGGVSMDFSKPWQRIDLLTAIEQQCGVTAKELESLETARGAMARVGLPTAGENNLGGIIEKLLEEFVEPKLLEPTFICNYPIETSPLAKKLPGNPRLTRRFEGYIRGREICNAFSEINDPIDQRERFEAQLREKAKGDEEAHPMDEDFIFAVESGMPPTGGCGIGMDRLAMLLTDADHVREVLFFPMMRPTAGSGGQAEES
jgi:lysyl-tRNA synthetase class 2